MYVQCTYYFNYLNHNFCTDKLIIRNFVSDVHSAFYVIKYAMLNPYLIPKIQYLYATNTVSRSFL